MPLAGTRVIPPGWSAHHRPVATGAMTATCSLRKPGSTGGSFDTGTGTQGGTARTPYLVGAACRVQAHAEAGTEQLAAEQQMTTMPYLVAVDWMAAGAVEATVGDLVDITEAEDTLLDGATLTVKAVVRGSLVWERDLYCTLELG